MASNLATASTLDLEGTWFGKQGEASEENPNQEVMIAEDQAEEFPVAPGDSTSLEFIHN